MQPVKRSKKKDDKFILLSEAAKHCQYSQEYLSLRARQGKLKTIKKGRNWITTLEWLREYVSYCDNIKKERGENAKPAPITGKRVKKPEIKSDFWVLLLNRAMALKFGAPFFLKNGLLGLNSLIKLDFSRLKEEARIIKESFIYLLTFINVFKNLAFSPVNLRQTTAGLLVIFSVFGLLVSFGADARLKIGEGLISLKNKDVAFAGYLKNKVSGASGYLAIKITPGLRNLAQADYLTSITLSEWQNFFGTTVKDDLGKTKAAFEKGYEKGTVALQKINERAPQKSVSFGQLVIESGKESEESPKIIARAILQQSKNLKNIPEVFGPEARLALNEIISGAAKGSQKIFPGLQEFFGGAKKLSSSIQNAISDIKDTVVMSAVKIGNSITNGRANLGKLVALLNDKISRFIFGEPFPGDSELVILKKIQKVPGPTGDQTSIQETIKEEQKITEIIQKEVSKISEITRITETISPVDYEKDLSNLEARLLLNISDVRSYLLQAITNSVSSGVTSGHTYIWAPAERIDTLGNIKIDGMTVRSGDILISTSGVINQTGTGQVTFSGNVDVGAGLNVNGGALTTGDLIATGDIELATTTITALTVSGTATSTFAGGIDVSTGCLAINGACVQGGASGIVNTGTQGQIAFYSSGGTTVSGTSTIFITPDQNVVIGTTSSYAKLTVWGSGSGSGQLVNVVNNASSSLFTILENGNVGIGTTSPYAKLSVNGEIVGSYFTATSTTATSTFALLSSSQSALGTVISGTWQGSPIGFAFGGTGLTSINQGQILVASAANTLQATSTLYITPTGLIGIGTTTPQSKLEI